MTANATMEFAGGLLVNACSLDRTGNTTARLLLLDIIEEMGGLDEAIDWAEAQGADGAADHLRSLE